MLISYSFCYNISKGGNGLEAYFTLVLLIAPGFIAKQTAKWLGDYTLKTNGQLEFIMSYFVYSLFSYCLIIALMFAFGMVDMYSLTLDFQDVVHRNLDVLLILLLTIFTSAFVGAVWQIGVKKKLCEIMNKICAAKFGRQTNMHDTLLNEGLLDGKLHLIRVIKDGQELAVGKFCGASLCGDEKVELMVDADPVYKEWLGYEPSKNDFKLRTIYLNFTDGLIVEEYNTPKGFWEDTYLPPLEGGGGLGAGTERNDGGIV